MLNKNLKIETQVLPKISLKKLNELGLLYLYIRESIIFEKIKDFLPNNNEEEEIILKNWFKIFNQEITKQIINFPLNAIKNNDEFKKHIIRKYLWIKWLQENFQDQIFIFFQENQAKYDLITYQLIRVKDKNLANEIYFKLSEDGDSFADLASKFSEGKEKFSNGLIGPISANLPNPILLSTLRSLNIGSISCPIEIDDWWIICKLVKLDYAVLNDFLKATISLELGDDYLNRIINEIKN